MSAELFIDRVSVTVAGRCLFPPQTIRLSGGDLLGIVGPSGCGKSTFLRAVAGLLPADGRVLLGGQGPETMGWPKFRRSVVYVHQQPTFLEGTVRDALLRPREYQSHRGLLAAHPRALASEDEWVRGLESLGLPADILGRFCSTLSVGEGQRVAFLRALSLAPAVLLLDEPTSALDPQHRVRVEKMLEADLKARQSIVLLVTHDVTQAERLGGALRVLGAAVEEAHRHVTEHHGVR